MLFVIHVIVIIDRWFWWFIIEYWCTLICVCVLFQIPVYIEDKKHDAREKTIKLFFCSWLLLSKKICSIDYWCQFNWLLRLVNLTIDLDYWVQLNWLFGIHSFWFYSYCMTYLKPAQNNKMNVECNNSTLIDIMWGYHFCIYILHLYWSAVIIWHLLLYESMTQNLTFLFWWKCEMRKTEKTRNSETTSLLQLLHHEIKSKRHSHHLHFLSFSFRTEQ